MNPRNRRHFCCAHRSSLNIMHSIPLRLKHPWSDACDDESSQTSILSGWWCASCASAPPENRKTPVTLRDPSLNTQSLSDNCPVSVDELIKCTLCIGSSLGHPDLIQYLLRFRLCRLQKRIQHIRALLHPAALVTGVRINLIECRPKPWCTVANRKLRHVHPTCLQIQQHLAPTLSRLANSVFDRQKLLLALIIHADHHQQTQLYLLACVNRCKCHPPHNYTHRSFLKSHCC